MTYRYKKGINADDAANDDDDSNTTQTQTLSSLTDFSSHIRPPSCAISVLTV